MKHKTPLRITLISASVVIMSLNGCSWYNNLITPKKVDYKSAKQIPGLDVPPDLSAPTTDTHFQIPDSSAASGTTYSAYSAAHDSKNTPGTTNCSDTGTTASEVLPSPANIKLERAGSERWLVVGQAPDKVWPLIEAFWQDNGFVIKQSDPATGIMQTNWIETPTNLPQTSGAPSGKEGAIAPATTESDAYRTRLERSNSNPNQTEIYITHQGMTKINNGSNNNSAVWQLNPPDPGLEAEMLSRLMVRLGVDKAQADALLAQHSDIIRAKIGQTSDGNMILIDNETFDNAWTRVGLALDRIGFAVVDRDQAKGIYFVRYIDPAQSGESDKKTGFFSNLTFWKNHDKNRNEKYQIELAENEAATSTEIHVFNDKGKPAAADTTKKILNPLLEQLK